MIKHKLKWSWGSTTGALLIKSKKNKISPWARDHEIKLFGPDLSGTAAFTAAKPTVKDDIGEGAVKANFTFRNEHHVVIGAIPSDGILMPQRFFYPEGFMTKWDNGEGNSSKSWYWIIKNNETFLTASPSGQQIKARIDGPPWSGLVRTSRLSMEGSSSTPVALLGTPLGVQLARMFRFTPPKGVALEFLPEELTITEIASMLILGTLFS